MEKKSKYSYFLEKRKEISAQLGKQELWELIDQWPLYCGVFNLARNIAVIDIVKSSLKIPGHIAEFGSWKGSNLMLMAKTLKIFDPYSNKKLYGFEGFEGLDFFDKKDYKASEQLGSYKGNYEQLLTFIDLFELEDEVILKKGNILETLPAFLSEDPSASFSLIYVDTDLYETTKLILEKTHSRLSKGGYFVLDEWNFEKWPGESIAVREFLKVHSSAYNMMHVNNTRQPSLILQKMI